MRLERAIHSSELLFVRSVGVGHIKQHCDTTWMREACPIRTGTSKIPLCALVLVCKDHG